MCLDGNASEPLVHYVFPDVSAYFGKTVNGQNI
jgi:hypothetical protein